MSGGMAASRGVRRRRRRSRFSASSAAICSRRDVLAAVSMMPLLATGCRHFDRAPPAFGYADLHVHLFNAHDLPVGMFLVDVIFRDLDLPRALKAVIDYLARAAARRAISAARERQRLEGVEPALSDEARSTPEAFAADFAAWAREGAFREPVPAYLFADEEELRAGYEELVQAVVADFQRSSTDAVRRRYGANLAAPSASRVVEQALSDLARRAESSAEAAPGENLVGAFEAPVSRGCGEEACPDRPYSTSLAAILRYLGWAYLMLKSREYHLASYLRLAAHQGEQPKAIVNHLVDYDAWLGADRLPGSSHVQQVEVAHALADKYRIARGGLPAVELRTFAGFCPLKHALEVRRAGEAPTFEALLTLADEGKVAGFKLYPPMGFQPSGNRALPNQAFDPRSNIRAGHFRTWSAEFGGAPTGHEIGSALDSSLESLYAVCERKSLPLMAHAGPGNQAGPSFGQRANPSHWISVAERYALRLSLGHLVNSAEDFVCAVRAQSRPPCVWALDAAPRLLNPNSGLRATVYGDLAFMPELIENPALATAFFAALAAVFGPADPKLTRIIYGSDYIMLGTMKDYDRHLSVMRGAMSRAGYDEETIANILERNALRYLEP